MTEQSAEQKTVTVEIKSRWNGSVLFSAEIGLGVEERFRLRAAVRLAVSRGANLCGANLCGANLRGANLCDANLRGANLCDADLCGANLCDADLCGANLCGANLRGADLRGADLRGANLCDADLCGADLRGANLCDAKIAAELTLIGTRPYFAIGPIGSESRYFVAWITNQGLRLRAGCFFGTRDEFVAALDRKHGQNDHAEEYRAALALIDAHVEIWTPMQDAKSDEVAA
jgi:hypothetical protein